MIVGWGVLLVIIAAVVPAWSPAYIALIAVAMGLAMGSGLESGRVGAQLHPGRAAGVHPGRLRRAGTDQPGPARHPGALADRDLDQVRAGGAAGRRDPDAAKAQIAEVEEIARQALADVRSTASAIREIRVAVEVAGARSVLLAAGIEAQVPAALPALDRSDQRTVRLRGPRGRHQCGSAQRRHPCTITVTEDRVEIGDNGSASAGSGGSGLRGLAGRMAAAGGELRVDSVPAGHPGRRRARPGRRRSAPGGPPSPRDDRTGRAVGKAGR